VGFLSMDLGKGVGGLLSSCEKTDTYRVPYV